MLKSYWAILNEEDKFIMNQLAIPNKSYLRYGLFLLACLMCLSNGYSQEKPEITKELDTTAITIGEQINYKVTVTAADSTVRIHFPEGQTFSPVEMLEASAIDTIKGKDKFSWIRNYTLSRFDSGAVYIPKQQIVVNDQKYFLDSVAISVAGVKVDTTKQGMYDIKPVKAVEEPSSFNWKLLLWLLIPLVIIAFIVYWFIIRKKPLTEEEKIALLPPFDRALEELKNLEKSRYLIESNHKGYYSELTTIVKKYLEEEIHISALESTTDELFSKIEMLQEKGSIHLEADTINNFKRVLQTADLVKFARSRPQDNQAEFDRKIIQGVVVETKESLPEPTVEELEETEAYKEAFLRKRKKKRILIAIAASVGVVVLTIAGVIYYYGFKEVKDTVLRNPSKLLLEQKWVTSEYGVPPIRVSTPEVLLRTAYEFEEAIDTTLESSKVFEYGAIDKGVYVVVATLKLKQQQGGEAPSVDIFSDMATSKLLALKAENLLSKQENFASKDGTSGKKDFGSFKLPVEGIGVYRNFEVITFPGSGYQQGVFIVYPKDDEYADTIVKDIETSIEVNIKEEVNPDKKQ